MNGLPDKQGHVRVENGMAVICVPADEIHGLLVALQPCPCTGMADALTWARNRI